jgi:Tol biopolymer transport system component
MRVILDGLRHQYLAFVGAAPVVATTAIVAAAFGTVDSLGARAAEEPHIYAAPVVFQRFRNDGATPDIPGFYGGASIWIMEANGSHATLLRDPGTGDTARHLDHPSVTSDARFVIYAEFASAALGVRGDAVLYKEDLRNRTRTVLRENSGCALHHATVSLDDIGLTYSRNCGPEATMLTELDGKAVGVAPGIPKASVGNGVSAGRRVVYQQEVRKPGQSKRAIAVVVSDFDASGERTDRIVASMQYRNRRPAISMDGRYVAWQSNSSTDGRTDDILLLDLADNDTDPERLTVSDANDGHPWFSRDGLWLLFESDRSGNWEIYKMHLPSRAVTQLTDDPRYVSTRPRW